VEQDPEAKGPKVSIKANKEVPSDSLQNPSDPDASYDGHKGQGYQMQVAETYFQKPWPVWSLFCFQRTISSSMG
jgi:hypothetical protein